MTNNKKVNKFNSQIVPVDKGWAKNSINTTIFRHNSIISHGKYQYLSYYDKEGSVIVARRVLGEESWEIARTQHKGNTLDAHNSISMGIDGTGIIHLSWDHHVNKLKYCRSIVPHSLEFSEQISMTHSKERMVTYPEFYNLSNGGLLFFYRHGRSGKGDLMVNRYDVKSKQWSIIQQKLIFGQRERNPYWQAVVDYQDVIHVSWCWRESPDVETNHDICYAKSVDVGESWMKSTGEKYKLPITIENAEYVWRIPQKRELVNTTTMTADNQGNPYIVTYWRISKDEIPQYHLIFHDGKEWRTLQISERKTSFSLRGGGTIRIPISRPKILIDSNNCIYVLFRDEERNNRVSIAICKDIKKGRWDIHDLTKESYGFWEPSYDTQLWKKEEKLHVFLQNVGQGDAESLDDIPPQTVSVLEWNPRNIFI